jgi:large subunit ribosomal protein L13
MKTVSVKPADIKKQWVVMDASNQVLGRFASEVARVLRGKHKTTFVPHLDCGDNVIIINAAKVRLTGKKMESKFYYKHTGFIGGIKAKRVDELLATHPDRVLYLAVKGMLKGNRLNRHILTHSLKIYGGAEHPHAGQNPQQPKPRLAK